MKKLILTAAAAALVGISAYGQGTVIFQNSSTTLVTFGTTATGGDQAGAPVPTGTRFMYELYYNSGTDPAVDPGDAGMRGGMMGPAVAGSALAAGRYSGGTRTTPTTTPPGGRAWFQVVAWETAFGTSYDQAVDNPGVGGRKTYAGKSNRFNLATGAPPGPATPISSPGGVMGFEVNIVPEPSTVALGILGGLGTLLLLRRRDRKSVV